MTKNISTIDITYSDDSYGLEALDLSGEDTLISDISINMNSGSMNTTSPYIYTTTTNGTSGTSTLLSGLNGMSYDDYIISTDLTGQALHVAGDANFEGDVKIKGKSLIESITMIEEKLAILHPNEELESKWEELRNLRKQYMELEKEIIEKEKVWSILKK